MSEYLYNIYTLQITSLIAFSRIWQKRHSQILWSKN